MKFCCDKLLRLIIDMQYIVVNGDMVEEVIMWGQNNIKKIVEHPDMVFEYCPYCGKKLCELGWWGVVGAPEPSDYSS